MFQKGFEKSDDRFSRIFQGFTRKFCCHDELQTMKHFCERKSGTENFSCEKSESSERKNDLSEKSAQATNNSTKSKSKQFTDQTEIRYSNHVLRKQSFGIFSQHSNHSKNNFNFHDFQIISPSHRFDFHNFHVTNSTQLNLPNFISSLNIHFIPCCNYYYLINNLLPIRFSKNIF